MSEPPEQQQGFHFLPEYAQAIANGANGWAALEYMVNSVIWLLADVKPALGACLTSQMYTMNAKLDALLSLLKVRRVGEVDQGIIDAVNAFSSKVRDALEARNRMVHDYWMNDKAIPENMGKLKIKASKKLEFEIESVSLDKLTNDVVVIHKRRIQFQDIRESIWKIHSSLPEMSQTELYPIVETQKYP